MSLTKKILAAVLVVALVFLLAACNNDAENALDISTINIGIITNGDNEETDSARTQFNAFRTAYETAGASKSRVTTEENVSTTDVKDMEAAMTDLVERGCRLVIGTDPGYYTELIKYAKDENNQKIFFAALADYEQTEPAEKNMVALILRNYETAYLEGIAAGMSSATGKIGYVADTAFAMFETADVNAFYLGAKSVNPNANVLLVKTDDVKAGIDKLTAAKCDVVYSRNCVTNEEDGTTYFTVPASVADCMTVNKINPDGTTVYVSGAVQNLDFVYTQVITNTVNEKFDSLGGHTWGIKEGAMDVAPAADAAIKAKTDEVKAQFIEGADVIGKPLDQLNAAFESGVSEVK